MSQRVIYNVHTLHLVSHVIIASLTANVVFRFSKNQFIIIDNNQLIISFLLSYVYQIKDGTIKNNFLEILYCNITILLQLPQRLQ